MQGVGVGRKNRIKNKSDKRFLETQSRLDSAIGKFIKMGRVSRLNTSDISKEANVWVSTFYDHYEHMDEAVNLYFHKMDQALKDLESEIFNPKKGCVNVGGQNLEIVFFKILYFVYQNREYYDVVIGYGNSQILIKIAETFRPIIEQSWSNYGAEAEEKCFCLFSWELSGVLYYWGYYDNFNFDRIDQYAKVLSRLARNATKRLVYG